jgi:hypothetical protein
MNYDTDGWASATDDDSVHDGSSVLEEDPSDEVFKYFSSSKSSGQWNPECLEWKICHGENEDMEDLIPETVDQICKNPHKSLIATMGLEQIRKGINLNRLHEARWDGTAKEYALKAKEFLEKEEELRPTYDETYERAKKVNVDLHHLQLKMATHHNSHLNFESHSRKYEHRAKIANAVAKVMKKFTAESDDIKVSVCVYCHLLDNQLIVTHKCVCLRCFLLSSLTGKLLHVWKCRKFLA